jgi:hypothetical protein
VFLLNVPLVLGGRLALRYVPENPVADGRGPLDLAGGLLAGLGLGGVIYALNAGPESARLEDHGC